RPLGPLHFILLFLLSRIPRSALFPYTTLFRSHARLRVAARRFPPSPWSGCRKIQKIPVSALLCCRRSLRKVSVRSEREILRTLRSEEHTSVLQSRREIVCRLLLEKKTKLILCS